MPKISQRNSQRRKKPNYETPIVYFEFTTQQNELWRQNHRDWVMSLKEPGLLFHRASHVESSVFKATGNVYYSGHACTITEARYALSLVYICAARGKEFMVLRGAEYAIPGSMMRQLIKPLVVRELEAGLRITGPTITQQESDSRPPHSHLPFWFPRKPLR